ncbi:MAG: hypothetical protein FD545_000425 [Pelagibacterales bacterium]|nr:hypothetical protein [Pelagibacterales bacterium]
MKIQKNLTKTNTLKKIFIKICRILGYEIIDQNKLEVPTQKKLLGENLSVQGKKSISIPLGEVKISRKVTALTVIFRSCTTVNMLTQSKKRLFEENKSEYTFRSLNSIISSLRLAKTSFPNIKFNIINIDHNSKKEDLNQLKKQLDESGFENTIISLNINEFIKKINKINAKKEIVTNNQISNMCNIYKSLLEAKTKCDDLIYFVEDDYLHQRETFNEMILTYERISSQLNNELILCPADYPFLYTKLDPAYVLLGATKHWRIINETLCTFLTSSALLNKHWDKFISMCEFEHYPFEKPLHDIYNLEYCLSPIPSMALHCTNINSIFGVSPNMDWEKVWKDNKNY